MKTCLLIRLSKMPPTTTTEELNIMIILHSDGLLHKTKTSDYYQRQ